MARPLLEREGELAQLRAAATQACAGDGSLVLIAGEAGIGKSSLVQAARAVLPPQVSLRVGYCDHLATPRVLGPLRDLRAGADLSRALASGDRGAVLDALRAELDRPTEPSMLVVEDVHWADEATLDVLTFLARRITSLPAVLVLTYRDDEITRDHPLRDLLGTAAGVPGVRRLTPQRLSPQAVRRLGAGTRLDADRVFAVTSGNPFFVTEVLAADDAAALPPTIVEAVAARLRGLDEPARDALERLAVVPSAVERWLVEAVVPDGLAALATAEQHGMLTVSPNRIAFRHELMRRAIADAMPAVRRMLCDQAVLAALLDRPGEVDLSRIMHHAARVGDADTIVRHGPAAARQAVAAQSHREAVEHYRLLLEHRSSFSSVEQAGLWQEYAVECYTIGLSDPAVQAQEESVALRRGHGDPEALGDGLRWLSRVAWWAGRRRPAEKAGAEAVEILEGTRDSRTLAMALSNQSQLYTLAGHSAEAIALGQRAVALAREAGDRVVLTHALNNVGFSTWDLGLPQGRAMLEESLAVALEAGEVEHACRAYVNTVWSLIGELRFDEARRVLAEGMELADTSEFLAFLRYMHVTKGLIDLAQGRWDDAEKAARLGVEAVTHRCPALTVLGRIGVRRGQPEGDRALAEAWEMALRLDEPQRIGPVGAALAEAAWLSGDVSFVKAELVPAYEKIRRLGSRVFGVELGYWIRTAGAEVTLEPHEHPYALLAAGDWREAAERWRLAGCPYEQAIALTHSPEADDLLQALALLDSLGAEPTARRVRHSLRDLGVTRIPRGPAPSTRDNPGGLTERQVEVVRLLAAGLSNAEIAAQLVISVRTVDSHVAAALAKLGARTRREAVAQARSLGLT